MRDARRSGRHDARGPRALPRRRRPAQNNAAAEKKDFASLTSRTVAGPTAQARPRTARARDAKSMPKATGRWTAEEHDEFLKCLDIYGREWKKVAERTTTRTAAQIRSHAQKYFKKIEAAGEGAPRPRSPRPRRWLKAPPQIPAETLAGALGALDDMLRALRSKRALRRRSRTPSEAASTLRRAAGREAAARGERGPRHPAGEAVAGEQRRPRAGPAAPRHVRRPPRAGEALELLREAAGGAF